MLYHFPGKPKVSSLTLISNFFHLLQSTYPYWQIQYFSGPPSSIPHSTEFSREARAAKLEKKVKESLFA